MGFYDSNDSIFAYMSKLANDTNAINLSQGFPDFPVSESLIAYVCEAMNAGYNQYAPMPGLPALREALSKRHATDYGHAYNPETEITITPGATQAIQSVIASSVSRGDEVVLFAPAYDCYAPMVEAAGGIPIWVELNPHDFSVPHDAFANAVNQRTKLVIINNPHNPCGTLWSDADISLLISLQTQFGFRVLADEVYEKIALTEDGFTSFAANESLRPFTYLVYSFGKTFHATGWKMGYVMAPHDLMSDLRRFFQFAVFSVNTPVQHALARYVGEVNYQAISEMYRQKQQTFQRAMAQTKFAPLTTKGSYFQLYDYSAISDRNDVDMAEWLTREHGVATIPVSVFYPNPPKDMRFLRFCFAKNDDVLMSAAQALADV